MAANQPVSGKNRAAPHQHVPQRTCGACRRVGAKGSFIRVVLTPQGSVEIDETGKKPGRGAYLCREKACWEKGLSERILGHALRIKPTPQSVAGLREHMIDLDGNHLEEGEK